MRLGKLNNDELERIVLSKFCKVRDEVLTTPRIGADCATVRLGGDLAVLSMDPITAAASRIGSLTVHVNCNDAAATGADPIGLMVTVLVPPSATKEELERVIEDLSAAAQQANVDIMGGHTEVTDAVTRIVTCATVLAKRHEDRIILPSGMREGDDIVMTKYAAMEGSAIIATDFEHRLSLSEEEQSVLKGFYEQISVVKEGLFAASHGATAMHDITEGGVLGAVWELASVSGMGACIDVGAIPVHPATQKLCKQTGLDPLRLLGSGSMLIACKDGGALVQGLLGIGVSAAKIGRAKNSGIVTGKGNPIAPPEADELYRLFSR